MSKAVTVVAVRDDLFALHLCSTLNDFGARPIERQDQ
jgi:hypothetical protein